MPPWAESFVATVAEGLRPSALAAAGPPVDEDDVIAAVDGLWAVLSGLSKRGAQKLHQECRSGPRSFVVMVRVRYGAGPEPRGRFR